MYLELHGIRIEVVDPNEIARFKRLGYVEVHEEPEAVEPEAEKPADSKPAPKSKAVKDGA